MKRPVLLAAGAFLNKILPINHHKFHIDISYSMIYIMV
jgi:hypothetical protein